MAFCRSSSFSRVLKHSLQLQFEQNSPFAKQSQYNFKHCDFVQLQCFRRIPNIEQKKTIKMKMPEEGEKQQLINVYLTLNGLWRRQFQC